MFSKLEPQYCSFPLTALQVQGPDAGDFLQRLSSVNVISLENSQAKCALFLKASSEIIANVYLLREKKDSYLLLVEKELKEVLEEELKHMHFSEDLSIKPYSIHSFLLNSSQNIWDKPSFSLGKAFPVKFSLKNSLSYAILPLAIQECFLFFCLQEKKDLGKKFLEEKGFTLREEEAYWEKKRVLSKVAFYGKDWEKGEKALNMGFLFHIDREKGCYPGQEAVEKSLNLGHPAKALVLLELRFSSESFEMPPLPSLIFYEEKAIGKLTTWLREGKKAFALGVVNWRYKEGGDGWQLSPELNLKLTIQVLK